MGEVPRGIVSSAFGLPPTSSINEKRCNLRNAGKEEAFHNKERPALALTLAAEEEWRSTIWGGADLLKDQSSENEREEPTPARLRAASQRLRGSLTAASRAAGILAGATQLEQIGRKHNVGRQQVQDVRIERGES